MILTVSLLGLKGGKVTFRDERVLKMFVHYIFAYIDLFYMRNYTQTRMRIHILICLTHIQIFIFRSSQDCQEDATNYLWDQHSLSMYLHGGKNRRGHVLWDRDLCCLAQSRNKQTGETTEETEDLDRAWCCCCFPAVCKLQRSLLEVPKKSFSLTPLTLHTAALQRRSELRVKERHYLKTNTGNWPGVRAKIRDSIQRWTTWRFS